MWALITKGVVQNIIIADQLFIDQFVRPNYDLVLQVPDAAPGVGVGCTYDGVKFSPAPPQQFPPPIPVEQAASDLQKAIVEVQTAIDPQDKIGAQLLIDLQTMYSKMTDLGGTVVPPVNPVVTPPVDPNKPVGP